MSDWTQNVRSLVDDEAAEVDHHARNDNMFGAPTAPDGDSSASGFSYADALEGTSSAFADNGNSTVVFKKN